MASLISIRAFLKFFFEMGLSVVRGKKCSDLVSLDDSLGAIAAPLFSLCSDVGGRNLAKS